MIRSPDRPSASAISSSHALEQSTPQPYSARIEMIAGLGVALTAKYSRKLGAHENALVRASAVLRMPASS